MTIRTKIRQLAAAALTLFAAQAYAALPYTDGDLILGFRAGSGQGGTTSYVVNIGSVSQFVGAAAGTVTIPGNIAADLETIYGSDWHTRSDVFWSISGTQFTAGNGFTNRTVFISKAQSTAGTQSIPWTRVTLSAQQPVALRVQSLGFNGYAAGTTATTPGQTESTNSVVGLIQDNGAQNSYASYMPGGANSPTGVAYAFYANGSLGIENSFEAGAQGSVIDLYHIATTQAASVGSPSSLLGSFRMSSAGVLSFSPNPADFGSGPAPAQVALSSATFSVNEDAGVVAVELLRTVNLTTAFSVNLSTTDGTATSANDYTAQSSVAVNFAASDTSKIVNIPIIDRAGFQGNRSFSVGIALGSGTATIISPTTATVTIVENDPQPATISLSAASFSIAENGGNAVVTLNRTGQTTGAVSVEIATTAGTALSSTDYTTVSTTVNFADGETTKTVNIPVLDRVGFQGDRAFSVAISAPGGGAVLGATTSANVTIQDNETAPSIALSAATYSVIESAGSVSIGLVRTGDVNTALDVTVGATAGTASSPVDFTGGNYVVQFAVGATSASASIPVNDVAGFQGNRTFNVTLSAPTVGGIIAPTSAVVTIQENDAQPGGAVAGNYSGLLKSVAAPTVNNTGAVALKISATGAFSGKVFVGGTSFSISGTFGANGVATFKNAGTSLALALKTKPTPTALGNFAMTIFGDSITGTLTNGAAVSNLTAERAVPYDGKTPATTVPVTILDTVSKGYHTGVLPSRVQAGLTSDKVPQGDGVVSFTVSKKGAFKAAGTLADGTKFSSAAALNKLNAAPLFAQLYKKAGLFAADLKFDSSRPDSDALALNALWIRPVSLVAKHYPDGWPAGITLDLLAARYRAPQKGDVASAFPGLPADDLVAGNATLTAADGKLAAPVVNSVNISAKNKVTNAPSTDKDFKLTFSAAKGTIGGSITHSDATKPKFVGIVVQKGPAKGGYGFFLSTKPKTGPTGESGGISLIAK